LLLANEELRRRLESCLPLRIIDPAPAEAAIMLARSRVQYLHQCNGCAEDIGRAANADYVLLPWVQKVSNLILNINAEIRVVETNHQRGPFVTAQHASRHHPRHLHIANVSGVNLVQLAETLVVHVACLHRPVGRVSYQPLYIRIGSSHCGYTDPASQRNNHQVSQFHCFLLSIA